VPAGAALLVPEAPPEAPAEVGAPVVERATDVLGKTDGMMTVEFAADGTTTTGTDTEGVSIGAAEVTTTTLVTDGTTGAYVGAAAEVAGGAVAGGAWI